MLIPEFAYGLTRDVKARSKRIVTELRRGKSWEGATEGPMLDTSNVPGLIVLDGPSPLVGGQPHFHVYLPTRVLTDALLGTNQDLLQRALLACLEQPWSTLSLQGQHCQTWLMDPAVRIPFLKACVRHWPGYEAEGERYSAGSNTGASIWSTSRCIAFALANVGAPTDLLRQGPGPAGISGMLQTIGQAHLLDAN